MAPSLNTNQNTFTNYFSQTNLIPMTIIMLIALMTANEVPALISKNYGQKSEGTVAKPATRIQYESFKL